MQAKTVIYVKFLRKALGVDQKLIETSNVLGVFVLGTDKVVSNLGFFSSWITFPVSLQTHK